MPEGEGEDAVVLGDESLNRWSNLRMMRRRLLYPWMMHHTMMSSSLCLKCLNQSDDDASKTKKAKTDAATSGESVEAQRASIIKDVIDSIKERERINMGCASEGGRIEIRTGTAVLSGLQEPNGMFPSGKPSNVK